MSTIDRIELKPGIPEWDARGTTDPKEMVLITQSIKELKEIMSYYVGIVRSNVRLKGPWIAFNYCTWKPKNCTTTLRYLLSCANSEI